MNIVTCQNPACRRTTEAIQIKREIAQRNENKDVKSVVLVSTNIRTCGYCNSVNIRKATTDEALNIAPKPASQGYPLSGLNTG